MDEIVWDYSWWFEEPLQIGRAETVTAPVLRAPERVREFPIGFHVSAPGPSRPEKPRVRVKAGSAPHVEA